MRTLSDVRHRGWIIPISRGEVGWLSRQGSTRSQVCTLRCVIWHESKLERMEMERIIIKDTRVFKRVSNIFVELFGFVGKI